VTTRPSFLPSGGASWWALAITVALVTVRLTMDSVQLGCAAAIVVLTIGLYVKDRTKGLTAVWLIWLLMPLLRRIFLLSEPLQNADPLALVPFLVTAGVVALELTQVSFNRRIRRMLMLVAAGYALGVPAGLLFQPSSA